MLTILPSICDNSTNSEPLLCQINIATKRPELNKICSINFWFRPLAQLICAHIFSVFFYFTLTEAKNLMQKLEFSLLKSSSPCNCLFLSWDHPEQHGPCHCWPPVEEVGALFLIQSKNVKTHTASIFWQLEFGLCARDQFCLKNYHSDRTCKAEQMFTTWFSISP